MEITGVTKEELAERALVSRNTVRRWRHEEYNFDADTALRIVIGLSLPPWVSRRFLEVTQVPLQYYDKHMLYRNLMDCNFMDPLEEVNDIIEEAGFERLKVVD